MKPKSLKKIYLDLLVIVVGFAVLAYLFRFPYLYGLSGVALLSALHPKTARWVSYGWETVGKVLGKINSTILLGIFFLLFITPFAILYRLTGSREKPVNSLWKPYRQTMDFNKPY